MLNENEVLKGILVFLFSLNYEKINLKITGSVYVYYISARKYISSDNATCYEKFSNLYRADARYSKSL